MNDEIATECIWCGGYISAGSYPPMCSDNCKFEVELAAHYERMVRKYNEDNPTLPTTHLEPNISHEQMETKGSKRLDKKVNIHIESRRHRLTDPGGTSSKAVIDGIVNAGILPDDSAKEIKEIRETQTKIPTSQPEITIIEITKVKHEA